MITDEDAGFDENLESKFFFKKDKATNFFLNFDSYESEIYDDDELIFSRPGFPANLEVVSLPKGLKIKDKIFV